MTKCQMLTKRLLLRPPQSSDIADLVALIGDFDVAKNLARVPHPYSEEDAKSFIARTVEQRATGTELAFAITRKSDNAYIGGCGLHLKDGLFEFGYWLGKPFWGRGFATEAARRLVAYGFGNLKADRLVAGWYHDNPASGHVLEKLGCKPAGAEERDCLARGHAVYCHLVTLDRADFALTKR